MSVSFVGFGAVVVTLRQALGARLSDLHLHFVRLFIEGRLAVAAFGLLPAALSTTNLADSMIWRLSSALSALSFSTYLLFLFRRRRRVDPGPVPAQAIVNFLVSAVPALALWVNAVGIGFQPNAVLYVLPLNWFLVVGAWVFLQNLDFFLRPPAPR